MGHLTGEVSYSKGLEGVVAAITSIAVIDGEAGKLIYRGIPIELLAEHSNFEETAYLLWFGDLPKKDELENLKRDLIEHREVPEELVDCIKKAPRDTHPMEILRTCVSMGGCFDTDKNDNSRGANIRKSIRLTAQMPTMVAYYSRARRGLDIVPPNSNLSHAQNLYYMLTGEIPNEEISRLVDVILILHMEHGMNASTFAAMVIASTLSDIYSAICGAISALRGPLHGGANERVLEMLQEIGSVENVEPYIMQAIKEHRRVMGFGHRVYKAYDPRARILKEYAERLSKEKKNTKWTQIAEKIEEVMIREKGKKGIFPNVDFYSGIIYNLLGFPKEVFTPIFAIARVVGWTAHVLEYLQSNRIFRPRALYNGPLDVEYIPIEKR
ncbi:MAG: citrate/2-methylcitrate synthase [Candidatus Aminicenantes bacterium]|nr:citrate/2-methylcitrate synthase [Candidatus Aminicenantes bacterium]